LYRSSPAKPNDAVARCESSREFKKSLAAAVIRFTASGAEDGIGDDVIEVPFEMYSG
tara:strand:- start:467 stop:637 length:171 start_codon:yes stop_codon:yes gene_type:complete